LTLAVEATSTSGQPLSGTAVIHTVADPATQCFTSTVAPVTGDQFMAYDPLPHITCGPVSPSNEVFCTE
jgi:hypothetical protein